MRIRYLIPIFILIVSIFLLYFEMQPKVFREPSSQSSTKPSGESPTGLSKVPDFNIFSVEKEYSTPTFFKLKGLHFSIQNVGNGTATNVTIKVVWSVKDLSGSAENPEVTVALDFGITNSVADAQDYYNRMVQEFGADSIYALHAFDKLEQARDAKRDLQPNEVESYFLEYPEDLNDAIYGTGATVEDGVLPTHIVNLGNVTFTLGCAEGVAETFTFD